MLQPAFAIVTAGSSSEYEIQPAFTGRTHSEVFKMRFMEKNMYFIFFRIASWHCSYRKCDMQQKVLQRVHQPPAT